jgi:hypothetical protein
MCSVVNINSSPYDIYIGRGSIWGNPFKVGIDGDRTKCIEMYAEWIMKEKHLMDKLLSLDGKVLGCYCKPLDCHGDVLVELVKEYKKWI